ncbi:MAG: hypothetical protein EA424_14505 [Planctomycetaceae bacterium]|nr:MAG: hypothetical protein EA424_14505 [Planctomycetaceae bacterium]
MSEVFDPYHRWLGIPPEDQPPDHYRLLGIARFETDREVIDSVAMRHMLFLQEIADGPHVPQAQQLLNELAAARRCLLDADRKAAYDAGLKEQLADSIPAPPVSGSVPASPSFPAVGPPAGSHDPSIAGAIPSLDATTARRRSRPSTEARPQTTGEVKTPRKSSPRRTRVVFGVLGSVALLVLVLATVWLSSRRPLDDPAASLASLPLTQHSPEHSAQQPPEHSPEQPSAAEASSEETLAAEGGAAEVGIAEVVASEQDIPEFDSTDFEPLSTPMADEQVPAVPLPLDGLLLWLDAADLSTIGLDDTSRVVTWSDKSEHQFQAKVDDGSSRPQYIQQGLGGLPVVQFADSTSLAITRTTEPLNVDDQYTILYVARGDQGALFSKGSGDASGSFAWTRGVAGLRIGGVSFAVRGDTGREARVRVVRADSDQIGWFIDGHAHLPSTQTGYQVRTRNVLRIGAVLHRPGDTQQFFHGQLAELLIYDRALEDDQRQMLESYLANKWLHGSDAPEPLTVELAQAIAADQPPDESVASAPAAPSAEPVDETGAPDMTAEAVESDERDQDEHQAALSAGYVALKPSLLQASGRSQLRLLHDGVVLSDGAQRENEEYRIEIETPLQGVTALRLEALPHESLPATGPGWAPAGRFSLAQFSARLESIVGSQPAIELRLTPVGEPGNEMVGRLVDGSDQTTWSVRRRGEVVPMIFLPATPIDLPPGRRLVVTLAQRENLGSFRLLATAADVPLAAPVPDRAPAPSEEDANEDADEGFVLFVNLGGPAYQDQLGNQWQRSERLETQDFGHEGGISAGKPVQSFPQLLWAETAIRGLTAFRASVPDGIYEVTLCFCEQWTTDADRRVFYTVWERGTPQAFQRSFRGPGIGGPWQHVERRVAVRDGQLDIEFSPVREGTFSILSGIIIRQVAEASGSGRKR